MSDPRERLAELRALTSFPPSRNPFLDSLVVAATEPGDEEVAPIAASTATPPATPTGVPPLDVGRGRSRAIREPRPLIGKPHGRQRCVSLYIPERAAALVRRLAADNGWSLGEAALELLRAHHQQVRSERSAEPVTTPFGPRRPVDKRRTGPATPVTVYVLWTTEEATAVQQFAREVGTSISGAVASAAGFSAQLHDHSWNTSPVAQSDPS